jgi:hypothetical protein
MTQSGSLSMGKNFPCNRRAGERLALLSGNGTGVSCDAVRGRARHMSGGNPEIGSVARLAIW